MKRLLFTGGGGAGNEAIHRLWRDRYGLHFADADSEAISPNIPAGHRHAVPFADDPGYAEAMVALCRELHIDVLVPGVDEELLLMDSVAQATPDTRILVPDTTYVATMLDKGTAMWALAEKGIDVPRTAMLKDAETIGFPCITKPREGRGSRGVHIINNSNEATAYGWLFGDNAVAQELVRGQEYTVIMAADTDARLHAVVPVKVAMKRGITLSAETERNGAVIAGCEAIHAAIPTHGLYNIQLMFTDDGRVLPFEINPRISTTFCLGIAAGVDPVAIFLNGAGDDVFFKAGLGLRRYWSNVFTGMEENR